MISLVCTCTCTHTHSLPAALPPTHLQARTRTYVVNLIACIIHHTTDKHPRLSVQVLRFANRTQPGAITGECSRGEFVPVIYEDANSPESLATAYCMTRAPGQCWVDVKTEVDYYPVVTPRHILSQASGVSCCMPFFI
jgi:hypothetical protein